MKKILSLFVVLILLFSLGLVPFAATTINGFTPYEKGGFVKGAYYPITAVAVGTESVKLTGKGGLSWPDTANNPVADAMGAIYNKELALDNLKFSFGINIDMNTTTDHWYAVTFANMPRLFNTWDGADPVKCGYFIMIFDGSKLKINVHNHTGGQSWNFMGQVLIPYKIGDIVNFQFKKQGTGFDLYANGSKLTFMNPADIEFTTIDWSDVLPLGKGYLATGAHVGNPDQNPYTEPYSYTIGVLKSTTSIPSSSNTASSKTPTSTATSSTSTSLSTNTSTVSITSETSSDSQASSTIESSIESANGTSDSMSVENSTANSSSSNPVNEGNSNILLIIIIVLACIIVFGGIGTVIWIKQKATRK